MVIPKISKMNFPSNTNTTTITKAVSVALLLMLLLVALSKSSVREAKIGTFAIGFMIAKKPVKTERVKARMLSTDRS